MIALIQRVTQAKVVVDGITIGEIEAGILLLLGVEKEDSLVNAQNLLDKVINFRIFEDANKKMNLSLLDSEGELLIVPQFTLAANTRKGTRPSFASAAEPEQANLLFERFTALARDKVIKLETGKFGADMQLSLINDGPVTFWLQK